MPHLAALFMLAASLCFCVASAFSGDFEISNVIASSPFQADPTSTQSTLISFDFQDQDTPELGSNRCGVEWAVGLSPPVMWQNTCDNSTFGVRVISWYGVQNFSLDLKHTYIDESVGQYPYNVLTKFAPLNVTYPGTKHYQCNLSQAECGSYTGAIILANVTRAIA
ncbi:uncharacterized protein A1O9_00426 [Exophiala aquamarina CBS 119918]|uniref:Uncharacterized protein n=1 Tax=Exophiala aquamarina CBS 119918 TaxID=1182545 RepID=A0A072PQR7_9EURO|nr:uncharacterized protein A1O9_00426 [Exophiala aquamarina CBS 119918]KEF62454.1 hypothetical protein A1O9_00426 [Exophiala aquamarina CBS 119918]